MHIKPKSANLSNHLPPQEVQLLQRMPELAVWLSFRPWGPQVCPSEATSGCTWVTRRGWAARTSRFRRRSSPGWLLVVPATAAPSLAKENLNDDKDKNSRKTRYMAVYILQCRQIKSLTLLVSFLLCIKCHTFWHVLVRTSWYVSCPLWPQT